MGFELTIVTPEGERFSGPVESVVLPGSEGEFGVLEGHERFLSPLRIGSAEIRTAGGTRWAALAEGFADVSGERVVLLVDSCELAEEIDVQRAEEARSRAREALDRLTGSDGDRAQRPPHEVELARAEVRLAVASRAGSPGAGAERAH